MRHQDVVRIIRILPNYSVVELLDSNYKIHKIITRGYPVPSDEGERRCTHVDTGMEWFFPAPVGGPGLTCGYEWLEMNLLDIPGIVAPEKDPYLTSFTSWLTSL